MTTPSRPSSLPSPNVARVVSAYLWRAWREGGPMLIKSSLLFSSLFLLILLTVFFVPNLLTPTTRAALEYLATRHFGVLPNHRLALGAAFVAVQGPFFVAILSSMAAANAPFTIIGGELNRGTLELLLSAPLSLRSLVAAMLATSLAFAAGAWAILTATTLGAALLLLGASGVSLAPVGLSYGAAAALLPMALTVLSALLAVFFLLQFPAFARFRLGLLPVQNPVILLSTAPALASLMVLSLRPGMDIPRFAAGILIAAAAASVVLVTLIPRLVRRESFLQEE